MEIWKDIIGYEGIYQVSTLGRIKVLEKVHYHNNRWGKIRRILKEKIMRLKRCKLGYLHISLFKNNIKKSLTVHRIVATHYLPNPNNLPEVNHKDGNKQNNNVDNLEWVSSKNNRKHAVENGLINLPRSENHWNVKLTDIQVKEIRKEYIKGVNTYKSLAESYNVSVGLINSILNKRRRCNV